MTLLHDPEWPIHRVVMMALYGSDAVQRAMLPIGMLAG